MPMSAINENNSPGGDSRRAGAVGFLRTVQCSVLNSNRPLVAQG
jgi:hypothetical protein